MRELISSWTLSLRAPNRSEHTQSQYVASVEQFARFAAEHGFPDDVGELRREHVEAFLADLGSKWKASTVQTRYKGLRLFFQWAEEEGEVGVRPWRRCGCPSWLSSRSRS